MSVSITNIEKYIAAARVYIGCQVPGPGQSMFYGAASGGVPWYGSDIGATQGEARFTYKATVEGVDIEQSLVPVAPHVTSEEATIVFSAVEPTTTNVKAAMGSATMQGTHSTFGNVIRFGGITAVTGQCVAIIAEQATSPGKYVGGMIYNAINDAGLERVFKRGKETVMQFTFRSFPNTDHLNRPAGERAGQYAEES